MYYSFLLDITDLTGSNNTTGGFFFSLNNTGNSSQTGNPSVTPGKVRGGSIRTTGPSIAWTSSRTTARGRRH